MAKTNIGWADFVWNPVTGCSKLSSGCKNCYAARMANRLKGRYGYPKDDPFKITFHKDKLEQPLHWKGPKKIFTCSMGDLFHEEIDIYGDEINDIFRIMAASDDLNFLLLTKRPERMKNCLEHLFGNHIGLNNVWIGTTIENENHLDRAETLLFTKAHIRWLSLEPLLGPIDPEIFWEICFNQNCNKIDWVVIGCESGHGRRPCKIEWMIDIVNACKKANKPVFVKQVEINGKVEHDVTKFPKELQIREFPQKIGTGF